MPEVAGYIWDFTQTRLAPTLHQPEPVTLPKISPLQRSHAVLPPEKHHVLLNVCLKPQLRCRKTNLRFHQQFEVAKGQLFKLCFSPPGSQKTNCAAPSPGVTSSKKVPELQSRQPSLQMIKTNKSPLIALVLAIRANTDHLLGGWSRKRRRGCCPEPNEASQGFEGGWGFTPKRHREGSSHVGCSTTPRLEGEQSLTWHRGVLPKLFQPAGSKNWSPQSQKGVVLFQVWLPSGAELLLLQISSLQPGSHSAEHPSSSRA